MTTVNLTNQTKPTNLTELNSDCLEKIFSYLTNIQDLSNIAEVDPKFHYPANYIYKKQYGDCNIEIMWFGEEMLFFIGEHYMGLNQLENFLNNFGDSIPSLELEYLYINNTKNRNKYKNVFKSLTKRSFESLENIHFRSFPRGWLEKLSSPLANVKRLTFSNCHLGGNMSMLGKIFPNVQQIYCFNTTKFHVLAARFPKLSLLKINTHSKKDDIMIKLMIKLNPNIKYFQIIHPNWNLLKFISNHLKSLETLEVTLNNQISDKKIDFYHLKHLKITTTENTMPFNINTLESLIIRNTKQHRILNELKVYCSIVEIDTTCWYPDNNNDAIIMNFINNTHLTEKIKFRYPSYTLRNFLRENIDSDKWTIETNFACMEFILK